jgi:hypothetical protein
MPPKTYTTATELPIVAVFQEGEPAADKISEFAGEYEDLESFGKYCVAAVESKFEMAAETLFPLLKDIPFRAIGIYLTLEFKGDGAYYFSSYSDTGKGEYYFEVQGECISCFLREFWEEGYRVPHDAKYAPHHELIHLLDHKQLLRYQLSFDSNRLGQMMVMFWENFRREGLAGLYGFLKIEGDRPGWEDAKESFLRDFHHLTVLDWENVGKYGEHLDVFQPDSIYDIGPWMVLHALFVTGDAAQREAVSTLMEDFGQGKAIPDSKILGMVKMGLQLPLDKFVAAMDKPGWNGKPWLQLIFFKPLFYRLEKLQEKRSVTESTNPFLEEVFCNVFLKGSFPWHKNL